MKLIAYWGGLGLMCLIAGTSGCGDESQGAVCADPNTTFCGGSTCVFLPTNPSHCGACGNACEPGGICNNGKCVGGTSDTDTDTDTDSDSDVDTDSDADGDSDPIECSSSPNLATHGLWIGCDPERSDDDPWGIQGGWYVYGDDEGSCGVTEPTCDATGCSFSGSTIVDDVDYAAWGCGLGLGLNTQGSNKLPYNGPAECFDMTLEGSSGGAEVRLNLASVQTPVISPFISIGEVIGNWSGELCFDRVECPTSWGVGDCEETGDAYDLQIQIVGAASAGTFNLKLTELIPKGDVPMDTDPSDIPVMEGNGSTCDAYGGASVYADGKQYIFTNNVWGSGAQQCVSWNGTSFTITSQGGSSGSTDPVSYPSVILGRKGDDVTSGSGLPIRVGDVGSITTAFSTNASSISGTFNAAYDIWIDPDQNYNGYEPRYFLMLWTHTQGDIRPAGSQTTAVSIEGHQWAVWEGGQGEGGGQYIAYQLQGNADAINVDLEPFFADAIANRGLPTDYWVINIQAGFEIWSGGENLECNYFRANVN